MTPGFACIVSLGPFNGSSYKGTKKIISTCILCPIYYFMCIMMSG